jgi:hypothetical protein
MKAMWADTHAKLSIDDKRVFASGFLRRRAGLVLDVEPVSGELRGRDRHRRRDVGRKGCPERMAVWLMCGETDMNLKSSRRSTRS